jgi:hypothetical protein
MLLEERREKNRRGKTEEKNKPKDLPGKTRGKRCLVLSTPTLRSKTAKQRQREKTYPVRRVSSTFFREREEKKTFRVAHDTLNKIEIFFLFWSKRETCAASFSSCTRQTSGGFLLPFANTVYEEREARIRTLLW